MSAFQAFLDLIRHFAEKAAWFFRPFGSVVRLRGPQSICLSSSDNCSVALCPFAFITGLSANNKMIQLRQPCALFAQRLP